MERSGFALALAVEHDAIGAVSEAVESLLAPQIAEYRFHRGEASGDHRFAHGEEVLP